MRWWFHVGPNVQARHTLGYWSPEAVLMRQFAMDFQRAMTAAIIAVRPVIRDLAAAMVKFGDAFAGIGRP